MGHPASVILVLLSLLIEQSDVVLESCYEVFTCDHVDLVLSHAQDSMVKVSAHLPLCLNLRIIDFLDKLAQVSVTSISWGLIKTPKNYK